MSLLLHDTTCLHVVERTYIDPTHSTRSRVQTRPTPVQHSDTSSRMRRIISDFKQEWATFPATRQEVWLRRAIIVAAIFDIVMVTILVTQNMRADEPPPATTVPTTSTPDVRPTPNVVIPPPSAEETVRPAPSEASTQPAPAPPRTTMSPLPPDPVDPVDPIDPGDLGDPGEPIDPGDPVDPVDPIDPGDLDEPIDPVVDINIPPILP